MKIVLGLFNDDKANILQETLREAKTKKETKEALKSILILSLRSSGNQSKDYCLYYHHFYLPLQF